MTTSKKMIKSNSAPVSKSKLKTPLYLEATISDLKRDLSPKKRYDYCKHSKSKRHEPLQPSLLLVIWDFLQKSLSLIVKSYWIGTFLAFVTICFMHREMLQISQFNESTSDFAFTDGDINLPIRIRCGSTSESGKFSPQSWFEFLWGGTCLTDPTLSLFSEDHHKENWISSGKMVALEILYEQGKRVHSVSLRMSAAQRRKYVEWGGTFQVFIQRDKETSRLMSFPFRGAFIESQPRWDTISFICSSSLCSSSYKKLRIEIASDKNIVHELDQIRIE